jgi:autotransporter-associated beta strand protein
MIAAVVSQFRLRKHLAATLAGALFSVLVAGPALAQTPGSWNVDASGLWSSGSNWLGNSIAGGVSGTATFANDITATRTVTLDSSRSLGSFIFGDSGTSSAASWIVVSASTQTMTMANGTSSATITVNALGTGATATISTVLASSTSPSIIKNGIGTLVLSATNNFTQLEIAAGTLQVSEDRNLGAVPGSFTADRLRISNNAILQTSTSFTIPANRGITIGSGGGTLNLNGGMLTLASRITGTGNLLSVTGVRDLTLQNSSGTASSVNWGFQQSNSNRIFFQGVNALGSGTVQVGSGNRLTSQSIASLGTLTNVITLDDGAGLTARTSGTGGAATYTNVIFPSAGTVVFNKDDQATAALTITSSGSLAGNLTVDTTQGGANAVGNVFLDGVFSGAGGLVKAGTGTSGLLILRGANTYTGTTRINAGTLQLGNSGTIGSLSTSSAITGSSGGTLAFNRTDTISSGTHFNSAIGGAIGVTQLGSGTVVLAGPNTYTGKTSIANGTLAIGNATSLGANPGSFTADQLTISNGATLRTTAAITLSANRGITIGTGTATISVNGGNLTAGRFTGAGNTVTVVGANALILQNTTGTATNVNWDFSSNSGVRTFFEGANALGTGSVRVRNGVKLTSQNVTSGTLTNAVTLDNGAGLTARTSGGDLTYTNVVLPTSGSVLLNSDDQATSALTILSGGTLAGDLTVSTQQGGVNAVGDVTLSGVLSGAGGLTKAGTGSSGILVLGAANTYSGNTTISTGTLRLGAAGSIANSGTISVASGAVFDTNAGLSLAAAQWLMGSGTVLGNVSSLGTIAPGISGSAGTLSFANNLSLDSGSLLSYGLSGTTTTVGGGINDLSAVTGNLSLDGTLNISEIGVGSFLSATQGNTWRLFTYAGTLTNNGLSLGSTPTLSSGLSFAVDTSTPNEVNLIVVPEPAATGAAVLGVGLVAFARMRRRYASSGRRD